MASHLPFLKQEAATRIPKWKPLILLIAAYLGNLERRTPDVFCVGTLSQQPIAISLN
jgi:hypothetical protein